MVTMHFKICLMALVLTFGIYPMIILNPVDRRFTLPRVITIPNKHVCIVSKATVTGSCCVVLSTGSKTTAYTLSVNFQNLRQFLN